MTAMALRAPDKSSLWRDNAGRGHRLSAHGAVHSWLVRLLRGLLPLAALILLGIVIAQLTRDPLQDHLAQLPANEKTVPGQSTLEGARYEGADTQGRPFVLTADRAVRVLPEGTAAGMQTPLQGETVDLVRPSAAMTVGKHQTLTLSAESGRYAQDSTTLNLSGGVRLFDQGGNDIFLDSATLNLDQGALVSESPVRGSGPKGSIDAEGLRLENSGEKVIFTGRTTLTLPTASSPKDKP